MRILLTGATGFVGRHVLPLLEGAGDEVFCLVRESGNFSNEILWDFLSPLPDSLPACEVVINLAAYVNFGLDFNVEQYKVNTVSVIKLVSYARKQNAFFIQASMAGLHGNVETINENTPVSPVNHYGMSKYLSDEVIKNFMNQFAVLRIGGIYGLDGPSHLGLNNAIRQALYDKIPPVLKSSGKAKRNYICVLDVARWIEHLVSQKKLASKEIRGIFYIAGSEIMTMGEYLEKINEVLIPNSQINKMEGDDGIDCVIKTSPIPFELTHFADYLRSIKNSNE